jgi:predicted nucleotidyltransferase
MKDIGPFLNQVTHWAEKETDILAVALVGSYARGSAKEDSDIDIVIIAGNPSQYVADTRWAQKLGSIDRGRITHENWGRVHSIRIFYADGFEVEFGITGTKWTDISPIDAGTYSVVSNGLKILLDQKGILNRLLEHVNKKAHLKFEVNPKS